MEAYRSWVAGMKQYQPAPTDLSRLNSVQRYFQKGSLDWSDYGYLLILVVIYWFLRPHIERIVKRWSEESLGEKERKAYEQRRDEAKVNANSIRSGKSQPSGKILGSTTEDGQEGVVSATATGTRNEETDLKSRKQQKSKKGASSAEKSAEDKTLDWEDDSEFDAAIKTAPSAEIQPEKNDIKEWMEKWTA